MKKILILCLFLFACDEEDCAGISGGSASLDDCYVCTGGTTGLERNYLKDDCGECGGENLSCSDCAGIPNGWFQDENNDNYTDSLGYHCGEIYCLNKFAQYYWADYPMTIYGAALEFGDQVWEIDEEAPDHGYRLKSLKISPNDVNDFNGDTFPDCIGIFKNLRSLNLQMIFDADYLPETLGNLINLDTLIIYATPLKHLPESLGQLTNLRYLSIWNTDIETLPVSIENLINLNYLSLSNPNHNHALGNTKVFYIGAELHSPIYKLWEN